MPHDAKGRLIEVGDTIMVTGLNVRRKVVGPVKEITPGAQTCSGQVMYPVLGGMGQDYFNANEALLLLKANGSEPFMPECSKDEKPKEVASA